MNRRHAQQFLDETRIMRFKKVTGSPLQVAKKVTGSPLVSGEKGNAESTTAAGVNHALQE